MNDWTLIKDFAILSSLVLLGTILKRKIRFFQKFIMPVSLIAGFIGLILSQEILGLIHFSPERLGIINKFSDPGRTNDASLSKSVYGESPTR